MGKRDITTVEALSGMLSTHCALNYDKRRRVLDTKGLSAAVGAGGSLKDVSPSSSVPTDAAAQQAAATPQPACSRKRKFGESVEKLEIALERQLSSMLPSKKMARKAAAAQRPPAEGKGTTPHAQPKRKRILVEGTDEGGVRVYVDPAYVSVLVPQCPQLVGSPATRRSPDVCGSLEGGYLPITLTMEAFNHLVENMSGGGGEEDSTRQAPTTNRIEELEDSDSECEAGSAVDDVMDQDAAVQASVPDWTPVSWPCVQVRGVPVGTRGVHSVPQQQQQQRGEDVEMAG
eukprot:TRINITY_DN3236_c0_g1_i1.p1 TRINITY_DN3236_c0_g1~~TRINITY_DN3236_c0_g1_i1.p1  ORF type:complete len:288 (+),score=105.90 TRINITY_DN3236_c0_g1_i1:464-1327(+)